MIPYFPKQFSIRAVIVYMISLTLVSLFYISFAMPWVYMVLGLFFVFGFFFLTYYCSIEWKGISQKEFVKIVFIWAFLIRIVWVIISYFYYQEKTGVPFEFGAADSIGYHETGKWLISIGPKEAMLYLFGPGTEVNLGDAGYPLYLFVLYELFGPSIIIPRILKAVISAYTCVLIYRIGSRTFGESIGRVAGIMCLFMPNLIIYCGYHLKETEMLFLEVAFMERLDYLIRSKKANFLNVFTVSLLALSLFLYRTVLGAAAVFSAATTVLLSSAPAMKKSGKRLALIGWGILCLLVASGGTIMTEIEGYWEERDENVVSKRYEQTVRGNQWAQYATGAVMAPMIFVLPFSTMVDVDKQYGQQEKHGGNFVRNFMGFFAILGIYEAFRRKKWRDFAMIGSFVIAYLGVVSLSGFSNSERFLLPGLPGLILIWSYGVSSLRAQTYRFLTPWCFVVVAMEFAWAFFKLGSRGLA